MPSYGDHRRRRDRARKGGPRHGHHVAGAVAGAMAAWTLPALGQVPSPAEIMVTPACDEAAPGAPYAISVTGRNFNPATNVLVTFDAALGGTPQSFQSRTDGFGRFTASITPSRRSAGAYEVRADDFKLREATATFVVPCQPLNTTTTASTPTTTPPAPPPSVSPTVLSPAVRLEPPIGRPGFVTAVVGSGFPPNAEVVLAWSPGLTVVNSRVTADGEGSFRTPMLVFHGDVVGPRKLVARPGASGRFGEVLADFLVVPGSVQPPGFKGRR